MEVHIVGCMEDDRLVGRANEVKEAVEEEARWVAGLPYGTWKLIAFIVDPGESPQALLSDTVKTMWVMVAYLWRQTMLALFSLPWVLAMGDVDANMDLFQRGQQPLDESSKKIWECLRSEEPWADIKAAIMLFRLVPWSILMAEQGHGNMSVVRRYHHSFGYNMCMARSLLSLIWCVLNPVRRDMPEERMSATLKRLEAKVPERASAQGQFLKDVKVGALAQLPPGSSGEDRRAAMQQAVGTHHAEFNILEPEAKRDYERKNAVSVKERREALEGDKEYVQAQLDLHKERKKAEEERRGWMFRTSAFHFTEDDHETLDMMWSSDRYPESWVQEQRRVSCLPPLEPSEPKQKDLQCVRPRDALTCLVGYGPDWMRNVALARSLLNDATFVVAFPGYDRYYLFGYAVQNPIGASFHRMDKQDMIPGKSLAALGNDLNAETHRWNFRVRWDDVVHEDEFGDIVPERVRIITHTFQLRDFYAYSDMPAVTLEAFWTTAQMELGLAPGLGEVESSSEEDSGEGEDTATEVSLSGESSGEGVDTSDDEPMPAPPPTLTKKRVLDEEQLARAYRDADALRRAWALAHTHVQQPDFRAFPRCGEGTLKKTGRLCDGIRGEAWSARSKDFVNAYRMRLQFSFTVSTIEHPEADCAILVAEYIQRMQYLLDIWVAHGQRDDYVFPPDAMAAYHETAAFTHLVGRPGLDAGLRDRVKQIRKIVQRTCFF